MFRVHLAADALMACEVHGRRGGQSVARKGRFPFGAGERMAAMQSLREWIAEEGMTSASLSATRRASQAWVLGIADVRYLLLPWTPDLADKALRSTFASALFEQQFKQDPGLYAIRFAEPAYGRAQLAAFVPHSLLTEIDAHARESRIGLGSVAPGLATVWDRFQAVLQGERGAVHVVDGDRQLIVHHAQGRMHDVLLRPFDAERLEALPLNSAADTRSRVFSAIPMHHAASEGTLSLADGDGFSATQDTAYAFALCGVL